MRVFTRILISSPFFLIYFGWASFPVFALTTPFRSAGLVTTDGRTPYINLQNCTATDGLTCDHPSAGLYADLYFRNFGTLQDFGIPDGSTITHVRLRVTGKATKGVYPGLLSGHSQCQNPGPMWSVRNLIGPTIKTQEFLTPVSIPWKPRTVAAYCLEPEKFENTYWRVNYSSDIDRPWTANIDNFEIAYEYEPPVTPPPVTTPLLIIPGIGGSELKVNEETVWGEADGHGGLYYHGYPKGETVWVNANEAALSLTDDYFDVLRMNPDGTSRANIGTTGNFLGDYAATVNYFLAHGYELNKTLFIFPYDWRTDVRTTTDIFAAKIATIKQQTGADKVNILAHSMGGLVARNYIADPARALSIDHLFTLGTPHLGAANTISKLLYGDCLTTFPFSSNILCLGIAPAEVKDVMHNMISGYQLAPSEEYYSFYTGEDSIHPYPFADFRDMDGNGVTGPLSYDQIKTLLTNLGHNTSLYNPAEEYHSLDPDLSMTSGVKIVNIVGSGHPTTGQIIEKNAIDFLGVKIAKKDEVFINGDETVPLYSASLSDPVKHRSLLGSIPVYYTNQTHGDLVGNGPALNLVENILTGNSTLPVGVATQPYSLNGAVISVHSPVALHIYNAEGNHTGPTVDGFEEGIPGSSYSTLDDAKFIFLPEEGVYTIRLEATDAGSFDMKIRKFEDNENTKTVLYKDVPLSDTTKAEAIVDTGATTPPVLHLDENGDGTDDDQVNPFSVLEGDANYDENAPALNIDVTPKTIWPPNNKMVDVHITGTVDDENPYLMKIIVDDEYDKVESSFSTYGETEINKTIQLEASRKGNDTDGRKYTIKIFSTDKAGNTSLSIVDVVALHNMRNLH